MWPTQRGSEPKIFSFVLNIVIRLIWSDFNIVICAIWSPFNRNLEKTGVSPIFLPVSTHQFLNLVLCAKLKLRSFRVPSTSRRRDAGGEVCVDVRSSVWAAVDGHIREGFASGALIAGCKINFVSTGQKAGEWSNLTSHSIDYQHCCFGWWVKQLFQQLAYLISIWALLII